jgi:uridine kinase
MDESGLIALIDARRASAGRPIVVGVSGYGGSGKSTLTRQLVNRIPGAYRLRGDDFLDPERSHKRSSDWDGVERLRLVEEVLVPIRERRRGSFRRYDWSARQLGELEPLPDVDILVVDLIGLLHPEALDALDLTVWCDVDLQTATQRGQARDAALGRNFEALWRDVWVPNEIEFERLFAPRSHAEVLISQSH